MPRSTTLRAAVLLVLVLLVAVPALQASAPRAEPASAGWDFLVRLWDFFTGIWDANGCEADPDGRCLPRPATVETDNGCELDPNGRCGA